ncbi:type II toxin-antitoxin system RelE/ParE family toxin [Glaciecola sp. 1036]|uniref:type II toxin-antitoxin system RelE/ParE family toxin n=1 Tax=Alteromonadaceae TaxID=72275 RepID=UPI003CFDA1B6
MAFYNLSQNAKEDLRRIYYYGVAEFGELQADKYFWGFFDIFENIAQNPSAYQAVDHIRIGYRRCVYKADTIYYRLDQDNRVEIVAIIGGQEIDEWL